MLGRFFLRLMGMEQTTPEPFDGRFGEFTYHVEVLPKDYASIWIHLPRNRMQVEPQLRKRREGPDESDEFIPSTTTEHFIDAILRLGAQSVDIGTKGDRIEATIPAFVNKVDKELADQVVALMVQIYYAVLGERQPLKMPRPWQKAAEGTLDLDGKAVTFEFSSCLVHTEDDLADNLDIMVQTIPLISEEQLAEHLTLALPGFDELASSDGYGQFDDGEGIIGLSFGLANSAIGFDDSTRESIMSLQDVEMYWGEGREKKLATVPCEPAPGE